jgi:predicted permease
MMPLPRLVTWIVRRLVPPDRADAMLADLEEDYTAERAHRGARWWLARETASLAVAYTRAQLSAILRSGPLLLRDCQMAARALRRGALPVSAAAALLAVGFAAVLLTSGLVQTLLFRQVSAVHGPALRRVVATDRQGRLITRFSFPELRVVRDHLPDAGELTSVYLQPVLLRVHNTDTQTMAEIVDGRYFALTGTRAVVGRTLLAADDRVEAAPAVVLAAPFWRRQFGGSPGVLGTSIRLNGTAFTVVGVADTLGSSAFMGAGVDAWVTLAHADAVLNPGWRTNVGDRWFTPFVLPASGATPVDSRLAAAATELARLHADPWRDRRLHTAEATVMVGAQRTMAATLSLVLGGLAALILVAAGSNVSGVLVARAAANQRAAAIHLSIGAGRASVVRRQLIEGAMIGSTAGMLSLVLYAWARAAVAEVAVLPTLALRLGLPLTPVMTALAVAAGMATGVLLAVGPALWSTRVDLAHALRDGNGRASTGTGTTALRRLLVSTQVALSVVLLVGAALFVRSADALVRIDPGFPRERLVAMDFDVEPMGHGAANPTVLAREALTRIERLTDVEAAAMSNRAPIDQSTPTVDVHGTGDAASRASSVTMYLATERYFEVVGLPLVSGRAFTPGEIAAGADVVIVNESLARQLWPGASALDRALTLPAESRTLRVVGVARDSKYRTLSEQGHPHIYRPTAPGLGLTLLARSRGNPRAALGAMQRELDAVGPGLVGFFPRTLDDHLAVQLVPARAAAYAASVLAVLALCLSAAALYALVAWFVVLRRREIGVRMALGASTGAVRALVIRQAIAAALPGLAVGVAFAVALGFLARSALYGVSFLDPAAYGAGIAALVAVVLVAGYLPSRAATRVDPASALRP